MWWISIYVRSCRNTQRIFSNLVVFEMRSVQKARNKILKMCDDNPEFFNKKKKPNRERKEACFLGQGTNLAYSEWTGTYVNDCRKCNRKK